MKESLNLLNNLFAYTHVLIIFIFDIFHYVAGSHIGYMYRVYIYIFIHYSWQVQYCVLKLSYVFVPALIPI